MIVNATFVSVWDGGTKIETSCKFDTEKKLAFDIESIDDVEDLDILDEEYITFGDQEISTFTTDEDRNIINGICED